jgi:hypothetical protein
VALGRSLGACRSGASALLRMLHPVRNA